MLDSRQRKVKGFRSRQFEKLAEPIKLVVIEGPRLVEQESLLALQFDLAALDDRESASVWSDHAASLARLLMTTHAGGDPTSPQGCGRLPYPTKESYNDGYVRL